MIEALFNFWLTKVIRMENKAKLKGRNEVVDLNHPRTLATVISRVSHSVQYKVRSHHAEQF